MRRSSVVLLLLLVAAAFLCQLTASQGDVRQPPTFIHEPESHVIYRSEQKIELPCEASGSPRPSYEWLKNNAPLNRNLPNIKELGGGGILIDTAGSLDEGYYQCIATNQYGRATSRVSFLQRAYQSEPGVASINEMPVNEGEPFVIQFHPLKSVPKAKYYWASASDTVSSDNPQNLLPSARVQWAENGDLHFAYAKMEDALQGRIYKGLTFNPHVDISSGGSYTRVIVKPVLGGIRPHRPVLAFSSPDRVIGLENGNITLQCFFSGNPEPRIHWTGPNALQGSRYPRPNQHYIDMQIINLQPGDEGRYTCSGSNTQGHLTKTMELVVQAVPVFRKPSDGPRNVNITEGESVTFQCNAYAKPEAAIVWMMNGKPLEYDDLPSRFTVSSDRRNLTIRSVCRDCSVHSDRRDSDLMVIQCNASNAHGYAYGSGYLNVLKKTTVGLMDESEYVIENDEQRTIRIQCRGDSDPSTPVSLKWHRLEDNDESSLLGYPGYLEPGVNVSEGLLTITAGGNMTSKWWKHGGSYKCIATNGYSSAFTLANITVKGPRPTEPEAVKPSILDYWWIFVIIAVLLLILIILTCCICLLRNRGDKYNVDAKERQSGNDPEKELINSGFHDYQRKEVPPYKGSQNSLGSSTRLFEDEDASDAGDLSGHNKSMENGSFHSLNYTGTTDRKKGRSEIV